LILMERRFGKGPFRAYFLARRTTSNVPLALRRNFTTIGLEKYPSTYPVLRGERFALVFVPNWGVVERELPKGIEMTDEDGE
jgi:hypothetical protein